MAWTKKDTCFSWNKKTEYLVIFKYSPLHLTMEFVEIQNDYVITFRNGICNRKTNFQWTKCILTKILQPVSPTLIFPFQSEICKLGIFLRKGNTFQLKICAGTGFHFQQVCCPTKHSHAKRFSRVCRSPQKEKSVHWIFGDSRDKENFSIYVSGA